MAPSVSSLGWIFALASLACGSPMQAGAPRRVSEALPQRIEIPRGVAPSINGNLSAGEWVDAGSVRIDVAPGWTVQIFFKHTESSLYFAFSPLTGAKEFYPEVVLDTRSDRTSRWDEDVWWFHASYSDCEGRGHFNDWNCTPTKPGWNANNYPLRDPGTIEMQISCEKLGLAKATGKLGIALALAADNEWLPWPAGALEKKPSTWGEAVLAPEALQRQH